MNRSIGVIAVLILAACVMTGCGDGNSDSNGTVYNSVEISSVQSSAPEIVISGFEYSTPESVIPGQTVIVRNQSSADHTVTSDTDGLFDIVVEEDDVGTLRVPDEPGTYTFHCDFHPNMRGTLMVK